MLVLAVPSARAIGDFIHCRKFSLRVERFKYDFLQGLLVKEYD